MRNLGDRQRSSGEMGLSRGGGSRSFTAESLSHLGFKILLAGGNCGGGKVLSRRAGTTRSARGLRGEGRSVLRLGGGKKKEGGGRCCVVEWKEG